MSVTAGKTGQQKCIAQASYRYRHKLSPFFLIYVVNIAGRFSACSFHATLFIDARALQPMQLHKYFLVVRDISTSQDAVTFEPT